MILDILHGQPKTILITGGLGFIGSHFVDWCLNANHRIINIDKVTYASNVVRHNKVYMGHPNYTFIQEDISTIESIPYCDIIVNFAAESHVDRSIDNPFQFIQSNILGVYNILELLVKNKIENIQRSWHHNYPVFFQISTDEVFGDIEEGFFKEEDGFNPSNPYSASKACAEMIVKSWGRTYNIPYVISRTTNNYGPRQHPEKLVPMCISRCLKEEKLMIHGTGEYVRNWIHVLDNINALIHIIQHGQINETYHISSDEEYSVNQIAQMILEYFGKEWSHKYIDNSQTRSGVDIRYALDNTKLTNLGWKQQYHMCNSFTDIVESLR